MNARGDVRRIIVAGALGSADMATSLARHAEEPPAPPRTAERERLREAVERHRETSKRLQRLRVALRQAGHDASELFSAAERAEEELTEAKKREPHRRAAELLGEVAPSGVSLAEAQLALTEARAAYDETKDVAGVLEAEIGGIGGAEFRVSHTQSAVDRALVGVISVDPAIGRLVERFDAARAEVAALSAVFKFLGLLRLPPELQSWFAENRPLPEIEPLVPAWRAAIAALEAGEVDVPLPSTE